MIRRRKILLEQGFETINSTKEPLVNKFVKFCSSAKLKFLMQGLVVWLIGSSVLISYIFESRGCIDASVTMTNCVLLVLAKLLGGSGPDISQTGCCPTMNIVATLISFATDSLLIAVFMSRITSPKAIIRVSDVMILKMRNNRLLFQIRMMNEFGHPMENVSVHSCYYRMSVSEEGERFTNIIPVLFECNYVCHAPQNISHFIDETSPLYGEELEDFIGTLEVTITATDTILGVTTSATAFFDKTVISVASDWETMFIKNLDEAGDDQKPLVDNAHLSVCNPLSKGVAASIFDAISWNKFNRDIGATDCPSVLKSLHGSRSPCYNARGVKSPSSIRVGKVMNTLPNRAIPNKTAEVQESTPPPTFRRRSSSVGPRTNVQQELSPSVDTVSVDQDHDDDDIQSYASKAKSILGFAMFRARRKSNR